MLDKLLAFNPVSRLTVEQALAHPYLEVDSDDDDYDGGGGDHCDDDCDDNEGDCHVDDSVLPHRVTGSGASIS